MNSNLHVFILQGVLLRMDESTEYVLLSGAGKEGIIVVII